MLLMYENVVMVGEEGEVEGEEERLVMEFRENFSCLSFFKGEDFIM